MVNNSEFDRSKWRARKNVFQIAFANAYVPTFSGVDESTTITIKKESKPEKLDMGNNVEGKKSIDTEKI